MFPNYTDYSSALRNYSAALAPTYLKNGVIARNRRGDPFEAKGAFALVTKITDTANNTWAVKLFFNEDKDREKRYIKLNKYIQTHQPKYFLKAIYETNGITINKITYPVLSMKWASGQSLSLKIRSYMETYSLNDRDKLSRLASSLVRMAQDLRKMGLDHADIQHDNIRVGDNEELYLVDYDDVFVKKLIEYPSRVYGIPGFQHPLRTPQHYGENMDNFSFWIIVISIYIIAINKPSWDIHLGESTILFGYDDLINPPESPVFRKLINSTSIEVRCWTSIIINDLLNVEDPRNIIQLTPESIRQRFNFYYDKNWQPKTSDWYNHKTGLWLKKKVFQ